MAINSFAQAEPSITIEDIAAIEEEYGFILPKEYKSHILAVNGGSPSLDSFVTIDEKGESHIYSVNTFYSIKYGEGSSLEMALEDLRDQLHPDLVPFADEAGGDQFCISVGSEDYGSIYYISHESYRPPKRKEMSIARHYGKGVYFLTSSFNSFLESLR